MYDKPAHDKTYIYATSEVSDQPARSLSLIRVFVDRMYLQHSGLFKEGWTLPYLEDIQAAPSLY